MNAVVLNTPNGITFARLAALKGAVRLESVGLKHSSGKSMRKLAAVEMGLKPSAKHIEVIAALAAKMEELLNARPAA
jgi:hypothetical protein